jgi:Domain of unknown function (DUF4157)
MHSRDQQHAEADGAQLKSSRPGKHADVQLFAAAATGRADVLGPQGLLHIQRTVGNAGAASLVEDESPVLDVVKGHGRALDDPVRADMEARLGHDFGDVRIHTGEAADDAARAVNAHAYTVGSDVVFQRDRYDPSSAEGRTLLAHELTHVVQQRNGPVEGTPAPGGIRISDPSDRSEREAAATAERVMSAAPVSADASAVQGAFVQREAVPEEDEEELAEPSVQGAFVQREAAPELEEEDEEAVRK